MQSLLLDACNNHYYRCVVRSTRLWQDFTSQGNSQWVPVEFQLSKGTYWITDPSVCTGMYVPSLLLVCQRLMWGMCLIRWGWFCYLVRHCRVICESRKYWRFCGCLQNLQKFMLEILILIILYIMLTTCSSLQICNILSFGNPQTLHPWK